MIRQRAPDGLPGAALLGAVDRGSTGRSPSYGRVGRHERAGVSAIDEGGRDVVGGSGADDPAWTVEVWADRTGRSPFAEWFESLHEYDQAVVDAVVTCVLARLGIDVCRTEWGKALGQGLYEVRVRRSLNAVLGWGCPVAGCRLSREPIGP